MVTSDEMLEFVRSLRDRQPIRDQEGNIETPAEPISGEDYARCLNVVKELVSLENDMVVMDKTMKFNKAWAARYGPPGQSVGQMIPHRPGDGRGNIL